MHAQELTLQIKVGVILVAAVVLGWLGYSLVMVGTQEPTYRVWVVFDNIQGIREGSQVKKAGTRVGYVRKIELDEEGKARAKLEIQKSLDLPQDATFIVNASSYIGESYMEIKFPTGPAGDNPAEPGKVFRTGQRAPTIDDLLASGERIINSADDMVNTMQNYVQEDPVGRQVDKLRSDLKTTLTKVNNLVDNLDSQVTRTSGNVNKTLESTQKTAENFQQVSAELRKTIKDQELQKSLTQISNDLKTTSSRLNRITEDVENITGDEQVQSDIKQTVTNTKDTMESAKKTLDQLRGTLKKFDRTLTGVNDALGQEGGGDGESQANNIEFDKSLSTRAVMPVDDQGTDEFRGDLNTKLRIRDTNYRLGVDNIGDGSDVRFQAGKISGNTSLRGGIYRGELSVGGSVNAGPAQLDLDVYDPNDVKTNTYLGLRVSPGYRLLFGVEDAFDENRLAAGLRYEF